MVNKSRIHRELGKFLMFSSNLIKLDNESMLEIGELQDNSTKSKIIKIDFDFAEKLKIEVGSDF